MANNGVNAAQIIADVLHANAVAVPPHLPRPQIPYLSQVGEKQVGVNQANAWIRRLVIAFESVKVPRDQWVRNACVYLRDEPAELWWAGQVELGQAANPPTIPQNTLTWTQFERGIVGVYMRDDHIPQLLDAFGKLHCKGVHDITNFCYKFEIHLNNLRAANIAMNTVVLAIRILDEMPSATAATLRTLPIETLHNHVQLLATARHFHVQGTPVPTPVALPQVVTATTGQDIPVAQVLQAVLQAMTMRGGMNRGGHVTPLQGKGYRSFPSTSYSGSTGSWTGLW
jgi:hypothetical protein